MFNGKRRSLLFESECTETKQSIIQTLLNFSFQESQHHFDNDSVNADNVNGITDGWKKFTSIYLPEPKNTTRLKKKFNGQSRSLGCFGNYRYDRKRMKLLFTDNLKLIYNSESYEYIPLNGVYQVSKSAEAFSDALNCKRGNFGKRILLPLNEPVSSQKDVNLVEENTNKSCLSLSPETENNFQSPKIKNVSSSASLSDLRIGVDNPFTLLKKTLNKNQFPKSKSADIKGKSTYSTIFEKFKEMFFDELVPREQQISKNIYYNSVVYPQFKYPDLVPSVQLKSVMQERKCHESSQLSKNSDHPPVSSTSQTNSNANSYNITSSLKTKSLQTSKKGNKAVPVNETSKNLNSRHNNYNVVIQPDVLCKQQSDTLTEEVLPEIFGKKIKASPSIHRWL
ncbi:uncharacterized protein LOC106867663 [Octopus bimaculoides]|uniref:Uncharacterized protein n=1 Tax=Octopus bimaculoides TaxID=37653 RepID=A0A0L8HZF6_OCTBM|nr:uncharacterized protein LOC106867663 [Octopus bimaculoides]|eukprot:XP_014768085.1 PREDICTED: uncharacterized protein LOC106867663 [Octopus bimaculoides]